MPRLKLHSGNLAGSGEKHNEILVAPDQAGEHTKVAFHVKFLKPRSGIQPKLDPVMSNYRVVIFVDLKDRDLMGDALIAHLS